MSTNNNKIATTSSANEDISEHLTQQIGELSINNDILTICANCGKEGNDLNTCNSCDLVAYCNAACKKKHRTKHKKKCERCAAELHDIELFKQPPPKEDCPTCMLLLPSLFTGYKYRACCGKIICSGCIQAVKIRMVASVFVHFEELQHLLQMNWLSSIRNVRSLEILMQLGI